MMAAEACGADPDRSEMKAGVEVLEVPVQSRAAASEVAIINWLVQVWFQTVNMP